MNIAFNDKTYTVTPVKTDKVLVGDECLPIFQKALESKVSEKSKLVVIAESVVAISQGRAWKIKDIKPRFLARTLSKFVRRVPHGIGLREPETMELAFREYSAARIIFAAFIAALTRPFVKGMFYRIVPRAALIDGPCSYTLPPFNEYATMGPIRPVETAKELANGLGVDVAIVDANDFGTKCLGASKKEFYRLAEIATAKNPHGQSCQQTPIVLVELAD